MGDVPSLRRVGPYEILGELGRGGMGVVYRARDPQLGRDVAVKMLLGGAWSGSEVRKRFLREAKLLAELKHSGIVPIHSLGETPDGPYYAMDLLDGMPLDALLERQKPTLRQKLTLFTRICEAVQHAHARGIVHRDLKPANVFVTREGRPVVVDFGLAHLSAQVVTLSLQTMQGAVIGTPAYMAPEQAEGKIGEIGPRTDVYALGVILYEMATGRLPFEGTDPLTVLLSVVQKDPPRPSALKPGEVPPDLEAVILKAMSKDPEARYASAADLGGDVKRFLFGQPVLAHPPTLAYRAEKWMRRRWKPAIAACAAGGLLVWAAHAAVSGRSEADRLAREREDAVARAEAERSESRRAAGEASARAEADRRARETAEAAARAAEERTRLEAEARSAERGRLEGERLASEEERRRIEEELKRLREERPAEAPPPPPPVRADPPVPPPSSDPGPARLKEARDLLQRAIELSAKAGGEAEALEKLALAVEKDPHLAFAHRLRGHLMFKGADYAGAEDAFRRAAAVEPGSAEAHAGLGVSLSAQGRHDEALAAIGRALEIDPADGGIHNARGWCLQCLGRLDEAAAAYGEAFSRKGAAEFGANRGWALLLTGKGPEAAAAFRQAIGADPQWASAHHGLGLALKAAGKPKEAVRALREAVERDPSCADAHSDLGWLLREQGKGGDAERSFAAALKADPAHAAALAGKGRLLLDKGRLDAALKDLERSLASNPAQPEALYGKGVVLQERRTRPEEVRDLLQAAIGAGCAAQGEARYRLGQALEALKDPAGAAAAYQGAMEAGLTDASMRTACRARLLQLNPEGQ